MFSVILPQGEISIVRSIINIVEEEEGYVGEAVDDIRQISVNTKYTLGQNRKTPNTSVRDPKYPQPET